MELLDKLNILADAAKYDAACTSSDWTVQDAPEPSEAPP